MAPPTRKGSSTWPIAQSSSRNTAHAMPQYFSCWLTGSAMASPLPPDGRAGMGLQACRGGKGRRSAGKESLDGFGPFQYSAFGTVQMDSQPWGENALDIGRGQHDCGPAHDRG